MNILVNQINWEYLALRKASYISFWFAAETLAPITLFEYGYHLAKTPEKLIVGIGRLMSVLTYRKNKTNFLDKFLINQEILH